MELKDIRTEIDKIDDQLVELFTHRMSCSEQVAQYKVKNNMPIFNKKRENEILQRVTSKSGRYADCTRILFENIMEISRGLQHDMIGTGKELCEVLESAGIEIKINENHDRVACFGSAGSNTHIALMGLYPDCEPVFYGRFNEIFEALENKDADYGIIPIENSSAGSVIDVYDLMLQYRFYIVSAADAKISHCIAGIKSAELSDIKKVYSKDQALAQCSDFIDEHDLAAMLYESTSAAAKMVSESGDRSFAAICSEYAANEYGLKIFSRNIQNDESNCTRFIVISREPIITSDADKISLCFSVPHVKGSLCSVLSRFSSHGLNLTKIESRPMVGKGFEYLFYLDFTGNVQSEHIKKLLCSLSEELPEFSFLGNYAESSDKSVECLDTQVQC